MKLSDGERRALDLLRVHKLKAERLSKLLVDSALTRVDLANGMASILLAINDFDEEKARESIYRNLNVADAVRSGEKIG